MSISLEICSISGSKWNKRLKNFPYGVIFYSKEMAYSKALRNQTPIFIKFVSNSGEIVGNQLLNTFIINKKTLILVNGFITKILPNKNQKFNHRGDEK